MILVTGAAGFIGSVLVERLNQAGYEDLVLVDDFSRPGREANLLHAQYRCRVERHGLEQYLHQLILAPTLVIHLGAHTDTSENDSELFERLNLAPSKILWNYCTLRRIPFLYASSASTYGAGEQGYSDDHETIPKLIALNPYGRSKQAFDLWVLAQAEQPPFWAGLKFFNVYGPNEAHKGRMASVVLQAYQQIQSSGRLKLFRSHKPGVADGAQARDFIYVQDVCDVILWLADTRLESGIFNIGTGQARSFLELATCTFAALDKTPHIVFVDTPTDIRDSYQYFTQADISKLRRVGYTQAFTLLEDGVFEYITQHLLAKAEC